MDWGPVLIMRDKDCELPRAGCDSLQVQSSADPRGPSRPLPQPLLTTGVPVLFTSGPQLHSYHQEAFSRHLMHQMS